MPQQTFVNLTVYDITGTKVKILLSTQKQHGYHSVIWDGTDDSGHELAAGVYFIQLTTRNFNKTKKIVLID